MQVKDTLNSSNETSEQAELDLEQVIPPSAVQFWTFLIFQIPSLACTIFLLCHLLINRRLRNALHNHIVIILLLLTLCIEVFDNPLYIDAYRMGGHRNSFAITSSLCLMWWFIDIGFYGAISVFLAWGSFERHILVFHHHQLLRTQKQRICIHYLPLIFITTYLLSFYIGVVFFPPCENLFDFESLSCGLSPCYEQVSYLNVWDYLGNGIVCTCIETISSIVLLIRVFWQRRRVQHSLSWRKHRKMAFQILSVSCLSLTIVFPQSLIIVMQQMGGDNMKEFASAVDPYFFYLYTFVVFLLPFICLSGLPEVRRKVWIFKRKPGQRRHLATVHPVGGQSLVVQPRPTHNNE